MKSQQTSDIGMLEAGSSALETCLKEADLERMGGLRQNCSFYWLGQSKLNFFFLSSMLSSRSLKYAAENH